MATFYFFAFCCFLLASPCCGGSAISYMLDKLGKSHSQKPGEIEWQERLKTLPSRRQELIEWQEGRDKNMSFSKTEEVQMRNVVVKTVEEVISEFIKPNDELKTEYEAEKSLHLPNHRQRQNFEIIVVITYCKYCTKLCVFCRGHNEQEKIHLMPEPEVEVYHLNLVTSCNKILEAVKKRYEKEDISSLVLPEIDLHLSAETAPDSPYFPNFRPMPFGFVPSTNDWKTTVPRFISANFKGVSLLLLVM